MNFLKKLLGKKGLGKVPDNKIFWKWFMGNERSFYSAVKSRTHVDIHFLDKLMPKLQQLNSQFYCLTGMLDEETAEMVITAEGDIKTFVFVEELIAAAPVIKGWKFTALKPPIELKEMYIEMDGYRFDNSKISFINNTNPHYPDEINLTLVHSDFNEKNKDIITNGVFIYLDNALGELNAATLIDAVRVAGAGPENSELIGIEKIRDFLLWNEKEFVENSIGARYNTE